MLRRRMLFQKSELPRGYIRCEYLENGGSHKQYIDTGIVPVGLELSYKAKVNVLDMEQKDSWIFGESASPSLRFTAIGFASNNNNGLYGCYDSRNFVRTNDFTGEYNFTFTKDTLVCNNAKFSVTPLTSKYSHRSIWLFGMNGYSHPSYCRVFHFSIFRNNEKILNFIPALDPSGRPCMYDTISKQPFYNKGDGEFLYKISGGA